MSDAPLLSCRNLSFRYHPEGNPVFERLSLTVRAGEAVLLMGPSGCGKSTLAYCLSGLFPEYAGVLEGEILLGQDPLSSLGPADRARRLSILFQNPDNQFCMDRVDHEILFALENINYSGSLSERMRELLCQTGLEELETAKIHTLSGGTKQKLALATALATGARLLILDEPFANLDPASCRQLTALLCRLNRQGMTFLIIDHRPDWWRPFLTRILLMEKTGDLNRTGFPPEELEEHGEEFAQRGLFLDDGLMKRCVPPRLPVPAEAAVKAEGLTVFQDRKPFLKDLSFQFPKGGVTALIGENGAGKTTLLTALAGAGKYKGTLFIQGTAGLVFQNPRFQFLTLSVEEEISATLKAACPKQPAKERAEALLKEFGLEEFRKSSPYELSQGQQRRLALLSMLAGDRSLLFLDEPTYAQDERSTSFILELLRRRVQEGLTVVMATHDLELALHFASQILLLENGKLLPLSPVQMEDYMRERRLPYEKAEPGL